MIIIRRTKKGNLGRQIPYKINYCNRETGGEGNPDYMSIELVQSKKPMSPIILRIHKDEIYRIYSAMINQLRETK